MRSIRIQRASRRPFRLLLENSRQNLPRHRCRRVTAAFGVFDQHRQRHLRLIVRREPDEPRPLDPSLRRVRLRRARFPATFNPFTAARCPVRPRLAPPPASPDAPTRCFAAIRSIVCGLGFVSRTIARGRLDALDQIRSPQRAAVGERGRHARHLQRRHQQETLADGHLRRVAVPPPLAALQAFPPGARHEPAGLVPISKPVGCPRPNSAAIR